MNIQQAINILAPSKEAHDNFIKQIKHFEIDEKSELKDYLQSINDDVLAWLNSAPENIKKESTFFKYKSPIGKLLEHEDVIKLYGHTYCNKLAKEITNVFSKHKKDIIKQRNNNVVIEDTNNITSQSSISDSDTSSDTESNDDSELDINKLVPADKINKNDAQILKTDNNIELQKQIEILNEKLVMQEKYYESIINYYKSTQEQLMKLLGQLGQFAPK